MFVSKQEILDAIKSENLIGNKGPINGVFNQLLGDYEYDNSCPVCAVGAVLRQKG